MRILQKLKDVNMIIRGLEDAHPNIFEQLRIGDCFKFTNLNHKLCLKISKDSFFDLVDNTIYEISYSEDIKYVECEVNII